MSNLFDEAQAQLELEEIAKIADKNQRLSWRRKRKRMDDLLEKIKPIEEKILALIMEKQPIMDEVEDVRQKMVKECIHPKEDLVHYGTHLHCKFCNRKLSRPING